MNAISIGFSVPRMAGLAALTYAHNANPTRNSPSTHRTNFRFPRSQPARFFRPPRPRKAAFSPTSKSSALSCPARSLFNSLSEVKSQKRYPHKSRPSGRLSAYPRLGSALNSLNVRGRLIQLIQNANRYHFRKSAKLTSPYKPQCCHTGRPDPTICPPGFQICPILRRGKKLSPGDPR